MTQKIIIVDDHDLVIDGLTSIVKEMENFEVIAKANNGEEALKLIQLYNADIFLMDIDMPVLNGLEASKLIKEIKPLIKIIILTMHNEASLIKKVMEIGVDGYLLKNADRTEFHNALLQVSKGKKYFSADVTASLLSETVNNTSLESDFSISKLTDRELAILKLIAEGYSNKEIGDKLYISHRTVDTHRTNIMKKLDTHNVASLIKIAFKNGLIKS